MNVRCYHPPINIIHLGEEIFVPKEGVFKYTKELYETGLGHKTIPPQREHELQEYFSWVARYKSANRICRWLIDLLMS